jgi:hypothetical protein
VHIAPSRQMRNEWSVGGVSGDLNVSDDLGPQILGWGFGAVKAMLGEDVLASVRRVAAEHFRKDRHPNTSLAVDQDEAAPLIARRS